MTHQMVEVEKDHWICPECGRQIILRLSPFYKEVLVEGDPVPHVGGSFVISVALNMESAVPKVFKDYLENIP